MSFSYPREFVDAFVTDIHGDDKALCESLRRPGLFFLDKGTLQPARSNIRLTIGGDSIDRWNENTVVLDRIAELRVKLGERLTVLPGNHELMADLAMTTGDPHDVWHWMKMGGVRLLGELCENKPQTLMLQKASMPFPVSMKSLHPQEAADITAEWRRLLKNNDLDQCNMPAAFEESKKLRERYMDVFRPQKLMHRSDDILMVHAKVDPPWIMQFHGGVDSANAAFRDIYAKGHEREIAHPDGGFSGPVWGRKIAGSSHHIDPRVASLLWNLGIRMYLHGHESQSSARPSWQDVSNLWVINGDLAMSRGMSRTHNFAGSVVVWEDGSIKGYNSWEDFDLGHLHSTKRTPPKGK